MKIGWVGSCVLTAPVIGKRKFRRRARAKHGHAASLSPLHLRLTGDSSPYLAGLHFFDPAHWAARSASRVAITPRRDERVHHTAPMSLERPSHFLPPSESSAPLAEREGYHQSQPPPPRHFLALILSRSKKGTPNEEDTLKGELD